MHLFTGSAASQIQVQLLLHILSPQNLIDAHIHFYLLHIYRWPQMYHTSNKDIPSMLLENINHLILYCTRTGRPSDLSCIQCMVGGGCCSIWRNRIFSSYPESRGNHLNEATRICTCKIADLSSLGKVNWAKNRSLDPT